MIVTLIKSDRIYSCSLPDKVKGRYCISDMDANWEKREIISFEGVDNKWIAKGNKKYKIELENRISEMHLEEQHIYKVSEQNEENAFLFCENLDETRKIYEKYVVCSNVDITIGRAKENDISIENNFISSKHARLSYFDGQWIIVDLGSTNGTFVNEYRVSTRKLVPGDVVYIMGFKLIIGSNFIAFNNPDNTVIHNAKILFDMSMQEVIASESEVVLEDEYFYRSPRFKRTISEMSIKIDAPPEAEKLNTTPTALLVGPAVTMGMASASTGAFSVLNVISKGGDIVTAMPTMIMAGSMLLGMILWPTLTRKHEKKVRDKNERVRQEKYKNYLFSIKDMILKEEEIQRDILFENNTSLDDCINRIVSRKPNLWERVIGQDDFLEIRVGLGNIPFNGKLQYQDKKFSIKDDNLEKEMYSLINEPKQLNMVPITHSFSKSRVCGIIGENYNFVRKFVKGLLIRMVALHSYDELKIVLIVDENNKKEWNDLRWLPHIWDNEKEIRFYITTVGEAKEVSSYLEKIYYERKEAAGRRENSKSPYYLIVNLSKSIAEKMDIIDSVVRADESLGFSIVNIDDSIHKLPKESSIVIEVDQKKSKIYDKNDISGKRVEFVADVASETDMQIVSKAICNIAIDLSEQRYALPNMLTFLDMFEVAKIEHINPLMRWKDNNPTMSLAAPIGVDTMGEVFYLDLHEKFQGPHGLVAGMTGSGKSEFIITYILSMAVNYHPDEVAFILIDYKGGGLTGAFEDTEKGIKLPHLAGTITNLDGTAVKRSLISIQSELRRRQAIFNEARRISNEGTMDIYKYQKLYREHIVSEPVPHLFIISDEFAELKSQQPEFMEQLISAARIGRSLGVHLILATQKPSGVVDDQIWSNSRFRVCLKVQERADSNDMIKRPDAAELSNTGRFYLQVGFNELFALGQSAWCGAPYNERGGEERKEAYSIQVVDNIGRIIKEVKPEKKKGKNDSKTKQIVAMVKYLSDLALEEKIKVRPLWLEPMPAYINVDELVEKYGCKEHLDYVLNPIVGEYDDPFNQSQDYLTVPISRDGNTVIYGVAGSGKLSFVTTMLYRLIRNHTAEFLNIYILDFGAETLKMFDGAPQVGDVVLSSEREKIINLMRMLRDEVAIRKKLFVNFGGDYESYIKNSGSICPNIVVVINNYAAFNEMYDECEEIVSYIAREGLKYGIYFVVTAANTGALRYRLAQNFKSIFVLQLNDKTDYAAILGPTEGTYPTAIKGRGLFKRERAYEFQTAYVSPEGDVASVIKTYIEKCKGSITYARKIPILPEKVDYQYLQNRQISLDRMPIGIDKKTLLLVNQNLCSQYISFVLSQDVDMLSPYLQGLAEIISKKQLAEVVVIDGGKKFYSDSNKEYAYICGEYESSIVDMFNEVLRRHKKIREVGHLNDEKYRVYILNSFASLFNDLSADGADKLKVLLDKGRIELKIIIVIGDLATNISKNTLEQWYKNHCSNVHGIWIGDGVADQYILKIAKITKDLYQETPKQFGVYINKGKYVIMKHIITEKYAIEEE